MFEKVYDAIFTFFSIQSFVQDSVLMAQKVLWLENSLSYVTVIPLLRRQVLELKIWVEI